MAQTADPTKEAITLNRLYLFDKNPRHDPIDNEPEIIAKLYKKEKVLKLAQHIAQNGISPLEKLAVVRHPNVSGSFVVVEGNRRLCALKLLRDPQKAPTPSSRRAFEELQRTGRPLPQRIEAALFATYADARVWMRVKHNGEQLGVGTVSWKPGQKTRFDEQDTSGSVNPNAQALQLLDYAEASRLVTSEERQALPLTTITRYLSNPIVRDTFGLANNSDLTLNVEPSEFDKIVRRFLTDALPLGQGETPVVNSRTNSPARANYARALRDEGLAPQTRLSTPIVPKPGARPPAAASGKLPGRNSRHPDKRPHVIPSEFRIQCKDKVLRRIFEELRTLDPEAFGFAGGYLLRAFVEQTTHLYANHHNLGTSGDLHNVLARCTAKLESNGAPEKATSMLRIMSSDRNSRLSVHTMGASVHCSFIPKAVELKRQWDSLEAGFSLMLADLH